MRTITKQEIKIILKHILNNAPNSYQFIKKMINNLDDSFYCSELTFKTGTSVNCVVKSQLSCIITNGVKSYIIKDKFNDNGEYILSYYEISNIEDEEVEEVEEELIYNKND